MSRMIKNPTRSKLLCAAAMQFPLWNIAAVAQVYGPESSAQRLYAEQSQEIVVTAQRREERAQDVPISLSQLSHRSVCNSKTSPRHKTCKRPFPL